MKKFLITVVCLLALSTAAIPVGAQTRNRRIVGSSNAYVYRNGVNSTRGYRYDDRSFWEKHRDKITTAAGAGGGALIGAIAGGKKGALIGALAGGGGAALYTYGIRDKQPKYYGYRR
jgi:hypothetical protein